jgi:hypothetical protein
MMTLRTRFSSASIGVLGMLLLMSCSKKQFTSGIVIDLNAPVLAHSSSPPELVSIKPVDDTSFVIEGLSPGVGFVEVKTSEANRRWVTRYTLTSPCSLFITKRTTTARYLTRNCRS